MTVLLDTHALLWAVILPERLGRAASAILLEPANEVLVSAASAWEIATKVRLGKLDQAKHVEQDFLSIMDELGFSVLPISAEIALRAGRLPGPHGDPFDRILAGQALALDVPILSNDAKLDGFGVRRIW